ncbi:MAG: helix-turn-helix transcriptional regulator [Planctomycetota bacterium]
MKPDCSKAQLAVEIKRRIKELRLTQVQAAQRMGIDQPKVSALSRGRLDGFSTDRLLRFLVDLGREVDIVIRRPSKRNVQSKMQVLTEA